MGGGVPGCCCVIGARRPRLQFPGGHAVQTCPRVRHPPQFGGIALNSIQFDSLHPKREENAHRDARLAREMRGLTSMMWDYKCAR